MAITNEMIIMNEAASHIEEVFTEYDKAKAYIMTHDEMPLHTFQGWKQRGYSVKKGEHAKITTSLWKFVSRKKKNEEEEVATSRCFMTKAYLFTIDQVQLMA